jgi:hypothetical protein
MARSLTTTSPTGAYIEYYPDEPDSFSYDPLTGPTWPENDRVYILGTPIGSRKFVGDYLQKKLVKHSQALSFITDVAKIACVREAPKMLLGSAMPRLSHILKSIPKDSSSIGCMEAVDKEHLYMWLDFAKAATLE